MQRRRSEPSSSSSRPTVDPEELAPDDQPGEPSGDGADHASAADDGSAAEAARAALLEGLPVAGITRRRVAFLLAAILSVWVVVVFARQVGEASAAQARAEQMAADNARLEADVAALQRELATVERLEFVAQQARGVRLGSTSERPFSLAPGASPLPTDAPGSASVRLGSAPAAATPLESWLSLLFGPSPGR